MESVQFTILYIDRCYNYVIVYECKYPIRRMMTHSAKSESKHKTKDKDC